MSIEYEADDLQFSSRIDGTTDNIAHILRRYTAIDRLNKVSLRGLTPLQFRYIDVWHNILLCEHLLVSHWTPADRKYKHIEFVLDADMYFYESNTIIAWHPDRELPFWLNEIMNSLYRDLRPELIGVVQHYLPGMKDQAKAEVKTNAIRRANMMLGNAQAILQFLEVV